MKPVTRLDNLLQLLQSEPDDVFLNYALALEYQKNPLTVQLADTLLRKVIATDANYLAAYYQLGKLLESQQQIADALQVFREGFEKAQALRNAKSASEFEEAIFMLED